MRFQQGETATVLTIKFTVCVDTPWMQLPRNYHGGTALLHANMHNRDFLNCRHCKPRECLFCKMTSYKLSICTIYKLVL